MPQNADNHHEDPARGGRDLPRLGRRMGVALFWVMAAYVVCGSALSIISSLYWPDSAPRPPGGDIENCARNITTLRGELHDWAARSLRGADASTRQAGLDRWDRRFQVVGSRCGDLDGARRDLGELRSGLESLLDEYERERGPTRERIRRALDAYRGGTGKES